MSEETNQIGKRDEDTSHEVDHVHPNHNEVAGLPTDPDLARLRHTRAASTIKKAD